MLTKIDPIEVLGLIAGVLTTTAYVPQVFRTWRLKTAGDISLLTISLTSAGIFLWFLYGLYIGSLSVTIANLITCILTLTVLVMKIRYGKNRDGRRFMPPANEPSVRR
jgi:MtN3 and saliva related transmembrane protein